MRKRLRVQVVILLILLLCPTVEAAQKVLNKDQKEQILREEWAVIKGKKVDPALKSKQPQKQGAKVLGVLEQPVTLKIKDLHLREALKPIAASIGHNIVFGVGVEDKKVSIDVSSVSIAQALETLLYQPGYGYKIKAGNLVILSQETRIFRVLLPPVRQGFEDVTSNESSTQSSDGQSVTGRPQVKLGTKIMVESSSEGLSFWDDVRDNLKILLSSQGQFSINKPAGSVIITDAPVYLNRIEEYFEDLNKRIAQQIEVDVKVVEVALNHENRFGVDWNILVQNLKTLNSVGLGTNFASGNFTNGQFLTFNADGSNPGSGVSNNGIKVAIDALRKQGNVEVVSQPKVTMLNNQVAVIQVGSTQSFIDRSTLESTQNGTISSVSTSQVQEGVTMRLLGNIVGDQIYLSVTPVVTTIDNIRSIQTGSTTIEAPQTTTKSINTVVRLNEGQTVAIGGLITSERHDNKEGVPVFSKIPLLGKLFQYKEDRQNKTELVIFITPKFSKFGEST